MPTRRSVFSSLFLSLIFTLVVSCQIFREPGAVQVESSAKSVTNVAPNTTPTSQIAEVGTIPDPEPTETVEPTVTLRPTPTLIPQLQGTVSFENSSVPSGTLPVTSTIPFTGTGPVVARLLPEANRTLPTPILVGYSYGDRPILDYQLGDGVKQVVLVGGMHGGYEWNTILLVYALLDYLLAQPESIPFDITLHIIPAANPDGQFAATGKDERFSYTDVYSNTVPGRFNGRDVDLNRNWDCQWMPTGTWRGNEVSTGTAPFSEPETSALKDYLLSLQPTVVVFYHSAANGVFAAGCPGVHQPSMDLATTYGTASGYPIYERFFHYEVNGDASDWLSTKAIPSFSVELINHEELDWQMNIAGLIALLNGIAGAKR